MGHSDIVGNSNTIETGLALWVKVFFLILLIIPAGILCFSIYFIHKIPNIPPILSSLVSFAGIPLSLFLIYKIIAYTYTKLRIDDWGIHVLDNYVWNHCAWDDFSADNLMLSDYGVAIRLQKNVIRRRPLFFKKKASYSGALFLLVFPIPLQHLIMRLLYDHLPENSGIELQDEASTAIGEWPFLTKISFNCHGIHLKRFFDIHYYAWKDVNFVKIKYPFFKQVQSLGFSIEFYDGKTIGAYGPGWYANSINSIVVGVLKNHIKPNVLKEYAVHLITDANSAKIQMLEIEDVAISLEKSVKISFISAYILGALSLFFIHYYIFPFSGEELRRYVLGVICLPLLIIMHVTPYYIYYKFMAIPVLKNIIIDCSIVDEVNC